MRTLLKSVFTIAVFMFVIAVGARPASAAANVSINAPTYGPMYYSVAVTTGDTIQVTVANGFTAIRVLTTSTTIDGGLRLWRESTVAGSTPVYAVLPNHPTSSWRYTIFPHATVHGWNEFSGFTASKFTLLNSNAGTQTFYVEVR